MTQICAFDPEMLNDVALGVEGEGNTAIDAAIETVKRLIPKREHIHLTRLIDLLDGQAAKLQGQTAQRICGCPACKEGAR